MYFLNEITFSITWIRSCLDPQVSNAWPNSHMYVYGLLTYILAFKTRINNGFQHLIKKEKRKGKRKKKKTEKKERKKEKNQYFNKNGNILIVNEYVRCCFSPHIYNVIISSSSLYKDCTRSFVLCGLAMKLQNGQQDQYWVHH